MKITEANWKEEFKEHFICNGIVDCPGVDIIYFIQSFITSVKEEEREKLKVFEDEVKSLILQPHDKYNPYDRGRLATLYFCLDRLEKIQSLTEEDVKSNSEQ